MADIFPSVPLLPKPPGTKMPLEIRKNRHTEELHVKHRLQFRHYMIHQQAYHITCILKHFFGEKIMSFEVREDGKGQG